ncbi:MAG: phosphoglycolate phosphatase [Pseudomonadota bacterium]|nr:phosphoglycolate phosphatase [Pseudomonadota bacterium]MDQ5904585.1 phosphoglycolate phosphatase [Pseudomonadota bacterium]MDQ5941719.1 phosphoglycolate phosphatase [Pseudomonadota bacterium]
MAKRFELLVFDWDGTLMDSAAAIVEAIQASCRDLDLPLPSDEQARHVIGLGLVDAMRHAVPNLPESQYPQMVERYRHHYLSRDHELRLFDGVAQLIPELAEAGYLLAVATGKSRLGLDRALKTSGLASLFHDSRCADECFSKPHPQMLEELMTAFAVEPAQTLMIGDTTHDLQMANNAGVASLAVAYGAHPPEALDSCSPLARLHSVMELREWLLANA